MAKVDWKKLKHANGSAARVPAQIQELKKAGHAGEAAAGREPAEYLAAARAATKRGLDQGAVRVPKGDAACPLARCHVACLPHRNVSTAGCHA